MTTVSPPATDVELGASEITRSPPDDTNTNSEVARVSVTIASPTLLKGSKTGNSVKYDDSSSTKAKDGEEKKEKKKVRRSMVHWRVEPYRSQMAKAIRLVREKGMATKQVALRFEIPPRTLRRYVSNPSRLGFGTYDSKGRTEKKKSKSTSLKPNFTSCDSAYDQSKTATATQARESDPTSKTTGTRTKRLSNDVVINKTTSQDVRKKKSKRAKGSDRKNTLKHSRRWSVEPYRSQMLRAITLIKHGGLPTTQVAHQCGIPPRTLRRYLNNTVKLKNVLKKKRNRRKSVDRRNPSFDGSDLDECSEEQGEEVSMSSVLDLMSLGNMNAKRSRNKKRARSYSSDSESKFSAEYDDDLSSIRYLPSPRGAGMGWTRMRTTSWESLETRGEQLQLLESRHGGVDTMTMQTIARHLVNIPSLVPSSNYQKGDLVMISPTLQVDDTKDTPKETCGVVSHAAFAKRRWMLAKVTGVRSIDGENVVDVTCQKVDVKSKTSLSTEHSSLLSYSIPEKSDSIVPRTSARWMKHPSGEGYAKDNGPTLVPNDAISVGGVCGSGDRINRLRSRAMSWSPGDNDVGMPRVMRARSASMEDPKIVASAFILTQIACPPVRS